MCFLPCDGPQNYHTNAAGVDSDWLPKLPWTEIVCVLSGSALARILWPALFSTWGYSGGELAVLISLFALARVIWGRLFSDRQIYAEDIVFWLGWSSLTGLLWSVI